MTQVLVPLRILEGQAVSSGLMKLLSTVDVTILGYHVVPDQTPPDQARLQYEDRANDALDDLCEEFRSVGGTADHRLVFTHNEEQTIDRIAIETGSKAVVIPGVSGEIERLLVPLSGDVARDRILGFVRELVGERDIAVTLFFATTDADAGKETLEAATATLKLEVTVETELAVNESPIRALIDALTGHDAIVMGEAAPSLHSLIFGDETEKVATESVGPVIVVRDVESLDA